MANPELYQEEIYQNGNFVALRFGLEPGMSGALDIKGVADYVKEHYIPRFKGAAAGRDISIEPLQNMASKTVRIVERREPCRGVEVHCVGLDVLVKKGLNDIQLARFAAALTR